MNATTYKITELIHVPLNQWSEHSLTTENGLLSVIIKRTSESLTAFINACPHQGRRMEYATNQFLETEDGLLICPAHGATFNSLTGVCLSGPCMGQSLKKLPAHIEDKYVFVSIS